MSKDQKKTINIPVETVDNFEQMLSYSISTLKFWHKDEEWPTNLITNCLSECLEKVQHIKDLKIISEASKDIKVSVSHINDK